MAAASSYSGSRFLFQLDDGAPDPGIIRSVSGGAVKGEIIEEGPGSDLHRIKHVGVVEFEPFELELGMAMSRPLFDWIAASWAKDFVRHNGAIIAANARYEEAFRREFQNALITETKFPVLDGSSKESAYLSVSLQPEIIHNKKGDKSKISGVVDVAQKKWLSSNFRLTIDGLDCKHINKIDSFSVKQKIKQYHSGEGRFPEIEPLDIDYGNLTIYTALEHAGPLIDWHESYIVRGGLESANERNGSIEFLAPNCADVLFTVEFYNIGIFGLTIEKSTAGEDEIKRAKVELYVEWMKLIHG